MLFTWLFRISQASELSWFPLFSTGLNCILIQTLSVKHVSCIPLSLVLCLIPQFLSSLTSTLYESPTPTMRICSGGEATLLLLLVVLCSPVIAVSNKAFKLRISCGARRDIRTHTPSSNTTTLWRSDTGYSGGIIGNATRTKSSIIPPLTTLRYFPLSTGSENCYKINYIPHGRYQVRLSFATIAGWMSEPLFDISIEGTQIYSMRSGWSSDDEQSFVEALLIVKSVRSIYCCFHSTGRGDPSVLSIEILQIDHRAYNLDEGMVLRRVRRISFGTDKPISSEMDSGERFWVPIKSLNQNRSYDRCISTETSIPHSGIPPNFFPEQLYQTAIISTTAHPELSYEMEVEPKFSYSIWLHFAEIDPRITDIRARVFDVLVNGHTLFTNVDIFRMTGRTPSAVVLKKTYLVQGTTLRITLRPKSGSLAFINGIEVFQVIPSEYKTSGVEVRSLQNLKSKLELPLRLGWNGDPCVPQQHPWSSVDCEYDANRRQWVIDGLGLNDQGLKGVLPDDIFNLRHLKKLNLSGNMIQGAIPSSLGSIGELRILDLSYNTLNGSIPESLGRLTRLKILNLNGNSLSGQVPTSLGGRLVHRASFNFTDNGGLCGIPGLQSCGPHLSTGAKVGVAFAVLLVLLLILLCVTCWLKRRRNIARAKKAVSVHAGREAPYAKARTRSFH